MWPKAQCLCNWYINIYQHSTRILSNQYYTEQESNKKLNYNQSEKTQNRARFSFEFHISWKKIIIILKILLQNKILFLKPKNNTKGRKGIFSKMNKTNNKQNVMQREKKLF